DGQSEQRPAVPGHAAEHSAAAPAAAAAEPADAAAATAAGTPGAGREPVDHAASGRAAAAGDANRRPEPVPAASDQTRRTWRSRRRTGRGALTRGESPKPRA